MFVGIKNETNFAINQHPLKKKKRGYRNQSPKYPLKNSTFTKEKGEMNIYIYKTLLNFKYTKMSPWYSVQTEEEEKERIGEMKKAEISRAA